MLKKFQQQNRQSHTLFLDSDKGECAASSAAAANFTLHIALASQHFSQK